MSKYHGFVESRKSGRLMAAGAVAFVLGCDTETANTYMATGQISSINLGGKWFTTKWALDIFISERSNKKMVTKTNDVPWGSSVFLDEEKTENYLKSAPKRASEVVVQLALRLESIPPGTSLRLGFGSNKNAAYRVQNMIREAAIYAGWYKDIPQNEHKNWVTWKSSVRKLDDGAYDLTIVHLHEKEQSKSVTYRRNKIKQLSKEMRSGE